MRLLVYHLVFWVSGAVSANLQSAPDADLQALLKEANRRMEAFEKWDYVQAESQKVLTHIEKGQVAQPRSIQWASELQIIRSQIAQMRHFRSSSEERCEDIIRQLEESFKRSYYIIRDQISQAYFYEDSAVFDRIQYEILMYQQLTWSDFIQKDAEQGVSSLLPGVARSCELNNRDQFKALVADLSQKFLRFHEAQYGIPGYKQQNDFLHKSHEHAIIFYERDRNVFIGTSVVGAGLGLGLPRLLAMSATLSKLGKIITVGTIAYGGWTGYQIADGMLDKDVTMILPGEEEIQNLLELSTVVVDAGKMQFVDLIDVLRMYNDSITSEKSKLKKSVTDNLSMLNGYVDRYGSVESVRTHLSNKIAEIESILKNRKNKLTEK